MLQGKTVLLGVTGGIACFKAAALASMLKKQHADVQVVMTENEGGSAAYRCDPSCEQDRHGGQKR